VKDSVHRPALEVLTSHWLTMLGAALVTTAGVSWLIVLPMQVRGHASNPYIGLVVFIAIPVIFCLGLALIPLGVYLGRRRIREGVAIVRDRRESLRRLAIFLGLTTAANLVIGTQGTYRAVEHMETVQFCGQSCHVMQPQFVSHNDTPHAKVPCVECHVAPGATGWVQSKMAGVRQLKDVVFNSYPRPVPSAMESNRLVPASETCEGCHWSQKDSGYRLRTISTYKDDEANTASKTVLMMSLGGGAGGGIHGAHMGAGVQIRYRPADAKRQTIPWVNYRNQNTNESRTYLAPDATPESIQNLPVYEMQCVDCHNRPTHAFELPERAVDKALSSGAIPLALPFIKKKSVELLRANYTNGEDAARRIPGQLGSFYREKYADIYARDPEHIARAARALIQIYNRNVFPDLKVTWGTYPNNLGHTDFTGCFRCHDEAHSTPDKKTITQDCGVCHNALAVDEASPEILKTLGLVKP
jgi:nitrate/TMAO reductase-like tetraheme cytochrome c subunit